MSVQVQCPKCAKQFKAKPELAGKRVKCSQCGAVITIPGGSPAGAAPAAAKPAPQQRPAAQQQPGGFPQMAPPMQQSAPQMGSMLDLLGDSKLGELKAAPFARQGEMLCPNCQEPGPMGAAVCVKCGFDFRDGKVIGFEEAKQANPKTQAMIRAILAAFAIIVLTGVTSAFVGAVAANQVKFLSEPIAKFTEKHKDFPLAWVNFGYAGLFVGAVLMVLFYFSLLADAFKAKPVFGWMFMFVPGFAIYFIATHWKETWWTFMCYLMGAWLLGVGLLIKMNAFIVVKIEDPSKKKKKSAIEAPRDLAQAGKEALSAQRGRRPAIGPAEYAAARVY
ncbi:MAG: hypothetical protein AB7O62_16120 [Pirellulales bacterium]